MPNEEMIAPVNHSGLSKAGATTAGVAGGAIKGGLATWLMTTLTCTVLGGIFLSGLLPVAIGGVVGHIALGPIAGALGGGLIVGPFLGSIGGMFGAVKGGSDASQRVRMEQGAANAMEAQLAAYQAQAAARSSTTNVYTTPATNENKFGLPLQGAAMNPAIPNINYVQNDGRIDGRNLQIT